MNCYECATKGKERMAVAICHRCSAGLCLEHAVEVARTVVRREPINRLVAVTTPGREFLCKTCSELDRLGLERMEAR